MDNIKKLKMLISLGFTPSGAATYVNKVSEADIVKIKELRNMGFSPVGSLSYLKI
jgi:hypothetical protein